MRNPLILALAALLLLPGAWVARAQDETPEPEQSTEETLVYEVDGWVYEVDAGEPLVVFADQVSTNNNGTFVSGLVFWRNADGTLSRLTACDGLAVSCGPLYTRATAALGDARQGNAYALAPEVVNDGD